MITSDAGTGIELGVLVVLGFVVYFVPTIVATARKIPTVGLVFVINLFLGWTFLGWVIALAMAVRTRR
jgi:hypothetical protein